MSKNASSLSVLLLAGMTFAPLVNAEWVRSEVRDEMRGSVTIVFSQTAKPADGGGPSATLMVMDKKDGKPGVVLHVEDGKVKGCPAPDGSLCSASIKFDDGKVREELFASDDGRQLIPTQVVAFAGSVVRAKQLFVELKVSGVGTRQYKFDSGALDLSIDEGRPLTLLGYQLGKKYPDVGPPLERTKGEGLDACYTGDNLPNVLGPEKMQKSTLCFFDGFFYSAVVIPGTKAGYASGVKYLTSVFGKPDPDGVYPSWPNRGGKLLDTDTRRASYFSIGKTTYTEPFIIADEIISPFVPQ
ncbi:hypothetical protein ACPCWF_05675 [Pseudomonas atacamensis]